MRVNKGCVLCVTIGIAAACSVLPAVALSGTKASRASSGGTVDFGLIADFTGDGSVVAPYLAAAEGSAVYDINAAGGILGQKVNTVPIDTKSDPADGVLAVNRALSTNHIVAELGPTTIQAASVVPLLQREHIITLCPCGSPEFDRTSDPYFWRVVPSDAVGGETLALAAERMHYTRIATVFGTDTGSQGDLVGVKAGVKAAHLKLVANIGLDPDQTSYRTQVSQLVAAKPQVIITESDGPTAGTFFSELKQLETPPPIFGTSATLGPDYERTLGTAIGAAYVAKDFQIENGAPAPASSQAAKKASQAYNNGIRATKANSKFLNSPLIEALYDSAILTGLAMTAAHSTNPAVADPWIAKIAAAGHGKTVVYTYPQGVAALKAGKKIQYVGADGAINFDRWHNSFGNQAMLKVTAKGNVIGTTIFTASEVQKLG